MKKKFVASSTTGNDGSYCRIFMSAVEGSREHNSVNIPLKA